MSSVDLNISSLDITDRFIVRNEGGGQPSGSFSFFLFPFVTNFQLISLSTELHRGSECSITVWNLSAPKCSNEYSKVPQFYPIANIEQYLHYLQQIQSNAECKPRIFSFSAINNTLAYTVLHILPWRLTSTSTT